MILCSCSKSSAARSAASPASSVVFPRPRNAAASASDQRADRAEDHADRPEGRCELRALLDQDRERLLASLKADNHVLDLRRGVAHREAHVASGAECGAVNLIEPGRSARGSALDLAERLLALDA